jgi:cytochrome P450
LRWLIAYLTNHPEVQDKVLEEIKRSVGLERLPGAQDGKHNQGGAVVLIIDIYAHNIEPKLPYVQYIIHEALRIRVPGPLAIPHSTSKNDVYKGWLILEGTIIVLNLHSVHNDSKRFENPTKFIPERHMSYVIDTQNKKVSSQSVEDRHHLSFSTGHRDCVDIHLSERNLYMAASMLLATFRFERTDGALIDVDTLKDVRAPAWLPVAFNVRLVPRHNRVGTFL